MKPLVSSDNGPVGCMRTAKLKWLDVDFLETRRDVPMGCCNWSRGGNIYIIRFLS
jgi:hypothetical protein